MLEAFRWYLALQLFGIAVLPVALHFFRFLPDRGYAFARPLGLLLVGYLLWIFGVFGLLENSPVTILVLLIIAAGASWTVFRSQITRLMGIWRRNRGHVLAIEGIFLVSFAVWVVIRAYNPEIQATEKPMEFAFLNATLRSTQLPPLDPWLSGYSISYYYFGYLFIAMIASLTQVPSSIAFNLAIPTIFALTATGAYSVGWNLAEGAIPGPIDSAGEATRPRRLIGPWFAGACTMFTMLILSNWEIFLELLHSKGVGDASFWRFIGIDKLSRPYESGQFFPLDANDFLWWFRASRVIGDYNSADGSALDYTINEFPFFSFILGDVHPHVLALPFVFLAIGYTLNLFRSDVPLTAGRLLRSPIDLAFLAIVYGGLWVLNAWDMPTQLFLLMIVVAIGLHIGRSGHGANWLHEALLILAVPFVAIAWLVALLIRVSRLLWRSLKSLRSRRKKKLQSSVLEQWLAARVATTFLVAILGCVVAYLPFFLAFRSQASGAGVVLLSTQWHHFLIFWGPLIFFCGSLLVTQVAAGTEGVPMLRRRAGDAARLIAASDRRNRWWIWPGVAAAGVLLAAALEGAISLAILLGIDIKIDLPGATLERIVRRALLLSPLLLAVTAIVIRIWKLTESPVPADVTGESPLSTAQAGAETNRQGDSRKTSEQGASQISGGISIASLAREHTFVLILMLAGILIIFGTEIAFIRDLFNHRMNTVFKLYYQAWTLMAIVAGYAIFYFAGFAAARVVRVNPIVTGAWITLAVIVAAGGLLYPVGATLSKTDYFKGSASLDGFAWNERGRPADYGAIKWLNENVEGSPVILEASGGSYSSFGRVSANTGLPTVLGWDFHEMQWRGNFAGRAERKRDIDTLYRTTSPQEAAELLSKYDIEYIYVGPLERGLYGDASGIGLDKFYWFLDIVYDREGVTIYRVRRPAI